MSIFRTTDEKTRAARYAACEPCPQRAGPSLKASICLKCGCPIVNKANVPGASCPLGKF
ncbi:MAG TPA: hypothetical protein VFE72_08835 [Lysobacter sp.]|nr:hypothetical protein [Lysobacter sp.]